MTAKDEQISAGFVAVLGAPNAGKSTLVNRAGCLHFGGYD